MNILLKNNYLKFININIISNNYLFISYIESINFINFNKSSIKKFKNIKIRFIIK